MGGERLGGWRAFSLGWGDDCRFFFFSFLLVKSQYEVFFQKLYLINWAVDGWEDGEPLSWAIIKTYAFSADLWRSLAD